MSTLLKQLQNCATLSKLALQQKAQNSAKEGLQKSILAFIINTKGQTVPAIAKHFVTSRQNIQVAVNEMLSVGLVTKQVNTKHKRSFLINASERGKMVYTHSVEEEKEVVNTIGLSDEEQIIFTTILTKIETRLQTL